MPFLVLRSDGSLIEVHAVIVMIAVLAVLAVTGADSQALPLLPGVMVAA